MENAPEMKFEKGKSSLFRWLHGASGRERLYSGRDNFGTTQIRATSRVIDLSKWQHLVSWFSSPTSKSCGFGKASLQVVSGSSPQEIEIGRQAMEWSFLGSRGLNTMNTEDTKDLSGHGAMLLLEPEIGMQQRDFWHGLTAWDLIEPVLLFHPSTYINLHYPCYFTVVTWPDEYINVRHRPYNAIQALYNVWNFAAFIASRPHQEGRPCSLPVHGSFAFTTGWPLEANVSGWWFELLWKILVNWDDYFQYMGK